MRVLKEAGKSIAQFYLKNWYGCNITNEETKAVAFAILQGREEATVESGSEEFKRLLDTPTQKSKQRLLDDDPKAFPGKQLLRMTIIRQSNDVIAINNKYG